MNRVALGSLRGIGAAVLALLVGAGCAMGTGGDPGGLSSSGTPGGAIDIASESGTQRAALITKGVAVGRAHSCALLKDTTVACWGAGDVGQLGDGMGGKEHARTVPLRVPDLTGVTSIHAGVDTTCATVGKGDEIKCWGDGRFGQLGNGKSGEGYFESLPVVAAGGGAAVDLDIAGSNACAVFRDGLVRCWGLNDADGRLGFHSSDCGPYLMPLANGDPVLQSVPCEATPKVVPMLSGAVHIVTGESHSCALLSGGSVSCWGTDSYGQLGDGMSGKGSHNPIPTLIEGLPFVDAISVGSAHSCALLADTTVRCWGDNSFGQLGIGVNALDSYKSMPTQVPALGGVLELHAATHTTCAVLDNETVRCWGDASELFKNPVSLTEGKALRPVLVPKLGFVTEVRVAEGHACVRLGDGRVTCWGLNEHGELGNGSMDTVDYSMTAVAF
jgi:alpha-tubulin suppressor-like RCC1 family protein